MGRRWSCQEGEKEDNKKVRFIDTVIDGIKELGVRMNYVWNHI